MRIPHKHPLLLTAVIATVMSVLFAGVSGIALASGPVLLAISSTPLTVIIPSHPQVLIALTNSNSMDSSDNVTDDGNALLTSNASQSAIMTWSGNVKGITKLQDTTSPINYQVPTGYTPPLASGSATEPYTAQVYTYTNNYTTAGGANWTCSPGQNTTIAVTSLPLSYHGTLPQPSADPPSTSLGSWPTAMYGTWDTVNNVVWYYNGVDQSGNNGFYSSNPGGITSTNLPSAERIAVRAPIPYGMVAFSPAAMQLGLDDNAGLFAVGMGGTHIKPQPRVGGGGTPPPAPLPCGFGPGHSGVACVIPITHYCHEWQWNPATSTPGSTVYTYYGDNSPSRLNIAKTSIGAVIAAYAGVTDFGLMDYSVSSVQTYNSWAYYMSLPGGFTFSNTYSAPVYGSATPPAPAPLISEYVLNPCYNVGNSGAAHTVYGTCKTLSVEVGMTIAQLKSYQYMDVAARGDDPGIDDVLMPSTSIFNDFPTFIEDGTITPSSPYSGFNIGDYNAGSIVMNYANLVPSYYAPPYNSMNTYPTNAGYVAFNPQVLYARRGQLWAGTVSDNTGNMVYPTGGAPTASAGVNPTNTEIAAFAANFTPFLQPENDVAPGTPSNQAYAAYAQYGQAIFASASQSPIAGILNKAVNLYGPAPTGTCPPSRYVILITDGLPTLDMEGNNWPPLGSAAAAGFGVNAHFLADRSLDPVYNPSTNNDNALSETITQLQALAANGVKTFVIGMGPGVDNSLNPQAAQALTAMAVAGGTGTASPTGYFPGTNPATVVADLQAILNIISVTNVSSVSAAANSSTLTTNTTLYQASYNGYSGAYHDWTGDIKAYSVDPATGAVSTTANWSAQCALDTLATGSVCIGNTDTGTLMGTGWSAQRNVVTWNPTSGTGVPFLWSSLTSTQQSELQPSDALGQDRLNYLRGDTEQEIHNGGADQFRDRTHILGDIVDSAPIYIGPAMGPYLSDPTYQAFVTASQTRTPMLYAGANDGMLHAFNAANGVEEFGFVPNGVFNDLVNLTSPNFDTGHLFYVDGSPSAGDVKFADGQWRTMLVGGLNDGGQSIYGIDVTDPSTFATQSGVAADVKWEFSDSTLGLTYSQPVIAKTNVVSGTNANPNGFLVFFGSGYNNSDGNDYIYAINPETGKQVAKINLCLAVPAACNATLPNGLSSPVVINSGGAVSQPDDTVYAGDLQGNMWKLDIADPSPTNWTVTLLYTAKDSGGTPQPITVTPVVSLVPAFPGLTGTVVYFGTGQYLTNNDPNSTQVQSFYAILDNGTTTTVTKAQLQQQVLTDVAAGTPTGGGGTTTVETRTVTNNAVNWSSQKGWYMNLPDAGERLVTDPRLYDGEVIFTSFVPSPGNTCIGGGQAFLMALNYQNGGSFPQPQLDVNGDLVLNSGDQVNGQNPVGIALGQVFASAPDIASTNIPGVPVMKFITLSTGAIKNVAEAGGMPNTLSWIQLQ